MTNFLIRRQVWGSPSELQIHPHQYTQIRDAVNIRREALYLEQKYDFIVENYAEFEEAILRTGVHDMLFNPQETTWFNVNRALFDRRIMNLLTTFKTYEDTYPQHVNRILGAGSAQLTNAKKKFSAEYDTRLGYRTMCKLRNFVQHEGLPVHGSNYQSQWITVNEDRKGVNRNTVDPYLRPDELRTGGFNKTVLDDLEAAGEKIDLKMLVRQFIEGLSSGHILLRDLLKEAVSASDKVIADAIHAYRQSFPDEESPIGLTAFHIQSDDKCEEIAINENLQIHRVFLEKKNPHLVNLSRRYVSGEIVDH